MKIRSWRTTLLGVLLIVNACSTAGIAIIDNDPKTVVDRDLFVTQMLAGIALINAKDAKVGGTGTVPP